METTRSSPIPDPSPGARRSLGGFTVLELLVACAVLVMMVALLTQIMGSASTLWTRERGNSAAFENSSAAFELLTRSLAQAMLNTYWGYDDPANPEQYVRKSELHFAMGPTVDLLNGQSAAIYPGSAVFFQAPLGRSGAGSSVLHSLLNSVGYFVRFGESSDFPDSADLRDRVKNKWRFRLYEWLQPTQSFSVFSATSDPLGWFSAAAPVAEGNTQSVTVAENIVGIILMAEYPSGNNPAQTTKSYLYDSRDANGGVRFNQLPPRLHVLMVAIDEPSAARLAAKWGESPPPIGPPPFTDVDTFPSDVEAWEDKLKAEKVNYRIYSATVNIRNAKWSQ